MEGYKLITRWFAQQMEFILTKKMRRFDRERNEDLLQEVTDKADELQLAYQTGVRVKESAFELGIAAMAIAFNTDRGYGEQPPEGQLTVTGVTATKVELGAADKAASPEEVVDPEKPSHLALPKRKRGPNKRRG